ncbi:MAG TPA: universal stress protein [Thermoanaerobaculia bacterium]|nr:universal stress protein [Thermoanaerobaculia bacterium]
MSPQAPNGTEAAGGAHRVLVALDASGSSLDVIERTFEQAARIARRLEAELVGLFVENRLLFELGPLHEIGTFSGALRTLDRAAVDRSLRTQGALVGARLARRAANEHVRWSFRCVRGNVVDELLLQATEGELFVLGRSGRPSRRRRTLGSVARALLPRLPRSVLLLTREGGADAPPGHAVVLHEGTAASDRALAVAIRLGAGERGIAVLPIEPPAGDAAAVPGADRGLPNLPSQVEVLPACDSTPASIVEALRARPTGVLVVPKSGALAQPATLVELAEGLDAPLLVVE